MFSERGRGRRVEGRKRGNETMRWVEGKCDWVGGWVGEGVKFSMYFSFICGLGFGCLGLVLHALKLQLLFFFSVPFSHLTLPYHARPFLNAFQKCFFCPIFVSCLKKSLSLSPFVLSTNPYSIVTRTPPTVLI